tara:strand:- start:2007 stop:2879 length:873 start_codon:yes stop_codon:yes gene_type:complete
MHKFLLFTSGTEIYKPQHLPEGISAGAGLYPVSNLQSIRPRDPRHLDLFFSDGLRREIVSLKVQGGSHSRVTTAIANAIATSSNSVIPVADVDSDTFIVPQVHGVVLRGTEVNFYRASGTDKTRLVDTTNLTSPFHPPTSLTVTPVAGDTVINLFLKDVAGNQIETTGILSNEAENLESNGQSVTLTVDTVSATNDLIGQEYVFKSDGTLIGLCTSVTNTTTIVFGNGILTNIPNNTTLYVGVKRQILESVTVRDGSILSLSSNEISYTPGEYEMYAQLESGSASIALRY